MVNGIIVQPRLPSRFVLIEGVALPEKGARPKVQLLATVLSRCCWMGTGLAGNGLGKESHFMAKPFPTEMAVTLMEHTPQVRRLEEILLLEIASSKSPGAARPNGVGRNVAEGDR
ncbi:MAG: hypothetical protein ACJAVK_000203 [Akkermansiaceae bacterium]|jgi:hypothetical protein